MAESIIPYGRQSIDETDIAAVVEVLRSDFLTQGPEVAAFEADLAAMIAPEVKVAAVSSATAALHLACLALDLGPGDRLWTVPNTFLASANCGRYCGAEIDFVDIDPLSRNIDSRALRAKLESARSAGALPKVIVAVDFAGHPCDWSELSALKSEFGFGLIDDASHALGASWAGESIGAISGVDATIFSFHPVKIIATGEGGAIASTNPEFIDRVMRLRSHGMVRDHAAMDLRDPPPWFYEQHELGYNYRMTDMQAALGRSQLRRLPEFLARRRAIADRYDRLLQGLVALPSRAQQAAPAWHLYAIEVDEHRRQEIFERLRAQNIGVQVHYIPVHLQPYYRDQGFRLGNFPAAERYYSRTISLPIYARLTDEEQDRVVAAVKVAIG